MMSQRAQIPADTATRLEAAPPPPSKVFIRKQEVFLQQTVHRGLTMLFSCDQQSLLDNYVVATAASPVWEEKQKSVKKLG